MPLGDIRAPYDGVGVAAYLGGHGTPGVEATDPSTGVHRRVHLSAHEGGEAEAFVVSIDLGQPTNRTHDRLPTVTVSGLSSEPGAQTLTDVGERSRRLLDVDADPSLVLSSLVADPVLGDLASRCPGIRAPGAWDGFEMLVKVIIGQQVSVAGARTMTGRLAEAFGTTITTPYAELARAFPSPNQLVDADLESKGFIAARSRAIRNVAAAVLDGTLALDADIASSELIDQLIALPGIGPWTATITAFRVCGDRDLFPPGDLALRRAAGRGEPVDTAVLDEWALGWAPVRSYAAHLLWRSAYLS